MSNFTVVMNNALKVLPWTKAYKVAKAEKTFTEQELKDIEFLSGLCKWFETAKNSNDKKCYYYYTHNDMDLHVAEIVFKNNSVPMQYTGSWKGSRHNYVLRMETVKADTAKSRAFMKNIKRNTNNDIREKITRSPGYLSYLNLVDDSKVPSK